MQVEATRAMKIAKLVTSLAASGRYTFSTDEAIETAGASSAAVRAALRRLRGKGELAMPARGFNVIIPPEYRKLGCLPAAEFIPDLMSYLGLSYYVGLLSAAEIHGAAHHKPQVFQVVTERNRRSLGAGRVRILFIAKANATRTPAVDRATDRGFLRVSTAAATAFDLVTYVDHAGGLDNAATVISELADQLAASDLDKLARTDVQMVAVQRLGYLLDLAGQPALSEPLARLVAQREPHVAPLRAGRSLRGSPRNSKWLLAINVDVEPDI
jgi:predicted transcriptional regulator of viral defense system